MKVLFEQPKTRRIGRESSAKSSLGNPFFENRWEAQTRKTTRECTAARDADSQTVEKWPEQASEGAADDANEELASVATSDDIQMGRERVGELERRRDGGGDSEIIIQLKTKDLGEKCGRQSGKMTTRDQKIRRRSGQLGYFRVFPGNFIQNFFKKTVLCRCLVVVS